MAAASSAGQALGFAPLPLRGLCGGGDRAQTQRPVALRMRQACLQGGLETVWEDVIKVMLAFHLVAPLLHTLLLCVATASFLGAHREGLEH